MPTPWPTAYVPPDAGEVMVAVGNGGGGYVMLTLAVPEVTAGVPANVAVPVTKLEPPPPEPAVPLYLLPPPPPPP